MAGSISGAVLEAVNDGVCGVIGVVRAPTLRQGLGRMAAELAATRPGMTVGAAQEWLASSFDLGIEVSRLRDGRNRVLRLAEPRVDGGTFAARDIFTFMVERTAAGGALEGSFHPTGVIPVIVEDLGTRGIPFDSSIFRRHPTR